MKGTSFIAGLIVGLLLGAILAFSYIYVDRKYSIRWQSPIFFAARQQIVKAVKKTVARKPTQKPTPTPRPKKMTSAVEAYVRVTFGKDAKTAFEIIRRSSEGDCNYKGRGDTHGLFGLHAIHKDKFEDGNIYNCYENIEVAHEIFKAEGKEAWGL